MATIHLTSEQFIARVADYKSSPTEFRFLGSKPALIDFYREERHNAPFAGCNGQASAETGNRRYFA